MAKKERNMAPDAKLGFGEKLAYGIGGGFATNAVNLFVGSFLLIYLTEILHVNAGAAATIIGVSKVLDGLSDLVAGRIIDKTHHKLGKARIWILRMIPVTIIALFLLYLTPSSLTGFAQYAWIFVAYNLVSTVCYTLTYVAFMALNGLMTTDQQSRGSNGGINMVGNVIASLLGNATIIPLLKLFSADPTFSAYGDRTGWLKLLAMWMAVLAVFQLILVFGTRERVDENEDSGETKKSSVPFMKTMKDLFTNKYWIINIVICLVIQFLMGATGSTTLYYMTYVVGDTEFYSLYSTVSSLAMLIAMLAGFGVMAKFGKRNAVLAGLIIRLCGTVLPMISNSKAVLLAAAVIGSTGYGIAGCAFASLIQDACTYGEWKHGYSMIGMGNAANSFSGKIGNSIGTIVLGWVLDSTGYVPNAAAQSASAIMGFRTMFIFLPAVMIAIAVFAASRYDLDKIYPQIEADLKEGKYAEGVTAR